MLQHFRKLHLLKLLLQYFSNPECVAIGECGLDFNRNFSPQDVQMEVFEKQV
jgi:TatD DNase family protein